jgi:hypothetical protein
MHADQKTTEQIETNFVYHKPVGNQPERYTSLREAAKAFAHMINNLVPSGREKSLALTKLEECVMHANSGISREPGTPIETSTASA